MYNLNLPPIWTPYNQWLKTTFDLSQLAIPIEEVEDIFLELSDNGCLVQFTSSERSASGGYLRKTLPHLDGLGQNLYELNNSLLDITIFIKEEFTLKECVLQKIVNRLYHIDIRTLSYSVHGNHLTLKCQIR